MEKFPQQVAARVAAVQTQLRGLPVLAQRLLSLRVLAGGSAAALVVRTDQTVAAETRQAAAVAVVDLKAPL